MTTIILVSLQCQVLTTFIIGTLSTQKEGKGKVYVQYYKERHTHKGERSDLKVKECINVGTSGLRIIKKGGVELIMKVS